MATRTIQELVNQSLETIQEIRNHPQFKTLNYQPDVTLGDAQQALIELRSELLNQHGEPLNIFALEGFTEKIGDWRFKIAD